MMPSNTPPPDHGDSQDSGHHPRQPMNQMGRQYGTMMQQWARQQQQQPQHHDLSPTDGSMLAGLNHHDQVAGYHYPQHSNLHHQPHETSHSYPDANSLHREQPNVGGLPNYSLTHHDASNAQHGSAMHPNAHSYPGSSNHPNHPNHPVGHYGNMPSQRFNLNQVEAENDLLSMMLMASRQATVPSMFNTLLNPNEQGESSQHDSEMLRAYSQSLNNAMLASQQNQHHQHQGNQGDYSSGMPGSVPMPNQFHFPGSQMPTGLRPSNNLTNSPPMYQQGGTHANMNRNSMVARLNPRGNDLPSMNPFHPEIPERIEPSGIVGGNMGMLDIPFGIQQQHLALELGEKRPHVPEFHKSSPPPKRKKKRVQRKKPHDMPRRPLSAYNLFFSAERERILKEIEVTESGGTVQPKPKEASKTESEDATCQALLRPLVPAEAKRRPHRKTHGKIGFRVLAQMVGQRWKKLPSDQRKQYQDLADKDMLRHKEAMEVYHKKQAEQKPKASTDGSESKSKDTGEDEGDKSDDQKDANEDPYEGD